MVKSTHKHILILLKICQHRLVLCITWTENMTLNKAQWLVHYITQDMHILDLDNSDFMRLNRQILHSYEQNNTLGPGVKKFGRNVTPLRLSFIHPCLCKQATVYSSIQYILINIISHNLCMKSDIFVSLHTSKSNPINSINDKYTFR